jgi:hypothetical protein
MSVSQFLAGLQAASCKQYGRRCGLRYCKIEKEGLVDFGAGEGYRTLVNSRLWAKRPIAFHLYNFDANRFN